MAQRNHKVQMAQRTQKVQKVQRVENNDCCWETKCSKMGETGRAEAPDSCRKTELPPAERVRPTSPPHPLTPLTPPSRLWRRCSAQETITRCEDFPPLRPSGTIQEILLAADWPEC